MLKREWGAESNGKLPHLCIPSKTATLFPEFAVEDLPLGRTATLVPEFAVNDLPLGRTLMMMILKSSFENREHIKYQFNWYISFRDIYFILIIYNIYVS